MTSFWHRLTEAGALTPVAAVTLCATLLLLVAAPRATTRRWIVAVLATGLAIALAKAVFIPCGVYLLPGVRLLSPSGHVAGSVAIFGGLAALLWTSHPGWSRAVVALAIAGLCTAIAVSRVQVGVHTVSDVISGAMIGLIVPVRMLTGPAPHPDLTRPLALGGLAAIPLVLAALLMPAPLKPTLRFSTEPYIVNGTRWLSRWSGVCLPLPPKPAKPQRPKAPPAPKPPG